MLGGPSGLAALIATAASIQATVAAATARAVCEATAARCAVVWAAQASAPRASRGRTAEQSKSLGSVTGMCFLMTVRVGFHQDRGITTKALLPNAVPGEDPVDDVGADHHAGHFAEGIDGLTQEDRQQGFVGWQAVSATAKQLAG